ILLSSLVFDAPLKSHLMPLLYPAQYLNPNSNIFGNNFGLQRFAMLYISFGLFSIGVPDSPIKCFAFRAMCFTTFVRLAVFSFMYCTSSITTILNFILYNTYLQSCRIS